MSAYTDNAIYTVIVDALESAVPGVKCYARYTETIEEFPAAFVYTMDITEPQRYLTLNGDSRALTVTYEIQLYSNLKSGAKGQVADMATAAVEALKSMYFRIQSARPVPGADNSIYRYVIRASRIIGEADEMPTP